MDLTGKLLIAMPSMGDPRFDRSVIFICAHDDEEGAMGLIINHPAINLKFSELLAQTKIKTKPVLPDLPIHVGGPVENGRGFVLHSADYSENDSTLSIDNRFGMTATLDVLEDIAAGSGPKHIIMALGYAGWSPGQLENEILANGWLTTESSPDLVFSTPDSVKWETALGTLGVTASGLSGLAGRA